MIRRFRKCQEIENKEREQYKEGLHTLNEKLTSVNTKLKEESRLRGEAEKLKAGLATELSTLRDQMGKAKTDTMEEFRNSQTFIDACSIYLSDKLKDCLKQVGSVYPNLDLSMITLDDLVPTTLGGGDVVNEKSDDSVHTKKQGPKGDVVVIAQPIPVGTVTPLISFAKDHFVQGAVDPSSSDAPLVSFVVDPLTLNAVNLSALDAPPS